MLQGRNPDWAMRPFFPEYDPEARWLNELRPAFGEDRLFYEDELERRYREDEERMRRFKGRRAAAAAGR